MESQYTGTKVGVLQHSSSSDARVHWMYTLDGWMSRSEQKLHLRPDWTETGQGRLVRVLGPVVFFVSPRLFFLKRIRKLHIVTSLGITFRDRQVPI